MNTAVASIYLSLLSFIPSYAVPSLVFKSLPIAEPNAPSGTMWHSVYYNDFIWFFKGVEMIEYDIENNLYQNTTLVSAVTMGIDCQNAVIIGNIVYSYTTFNLDTKELDPVPFTVPGSRCYFTLCSYSIYILTVQGSNCGGCCEDEIQFFHTTSYTWEKYITLSSDAPRKLHSCEIVNDNLYVIGGQTNSGTYDTVMKLDLTTLTPSPTINSYDALVGTLSNPQSYVRSWVYDYFIYVIVSNELNVDIINTNTGSITVDSTLNQANQEQTVVVANNYVYIFAGQTAADRQRAILGPTTSPTAAPSQPPTSAPSYSPSKSPTMTPSNAPTLAPTDFPSNVPTLPPTDSPSYFPTLAPTAAPTNAPSTAPTHSPSLSTLSPSYSPTNAPSSDHYNIMTDTVLILFIIFIICCLCLVIIVVLCTCHKRQQQSETIEDADTDADDKDVIVDNPQNDAQTNIELVEENDEEEEQDIELWLKYIVKLPMYYSLFIDNGYTSLEFIADIRDKSELTEIGIDKLGHQTRLLAEIKRLKMTKGYREDIGKVQKEQKEENDEQNKEKQNVKLWLENVVHLPIYSELFIENGYDEVRVIQSIKTETDLEEIGITTVSHQVQIMDAIRILDKQWSAGTARSDEEVVIAVVDVNNERGEVDIKGPTVSANTFINDDEQSIESNNQQTTARVPDSLTSLSEMWTVQ